MAVRCASSSEIPYNTIFITLRFRGLSSKIHRSLRSAAALGLPAQFAGADSPYRSTTVFAACFPESVLSGNGADDVSGRRIVSLQRNEECSSTFSLSRAQSRTCSDYAEARKRREKLTVFVKPSAEPRLRELCRGEKIKNEIHRFLPVFRGKSYLCGIESGYLRRSKFENKIGQV